MSAILQDRLPYAMPGDSLPGIRPFDMADWLHVDAAYGAQMARRLDLLRDRRDAVLAETEAARAPALELLEMVLAQLVARDDFSIGLRGVRCPDGRRVALDRDDPLATLGALVQEDFCLLERQGAEHVLTGAVLCFPASWMLAEKIGRPLVHIHHTVPDYAGDLARRVQRLFDGVRPGRPMWRANGLWYADPELHQPRSIHDRRGERDAASAAYFRSERQCILRLPQTGAVVFSIHTYVLDAATLDGRA